VARGGVQSFNVKTTGADIRNRTISPSRRPGSVNLTARAHRGRIEHGQADRATAAFASEVLK